jgi:hypothetical protein
VNWRKKADLVDIAVGLDKAKDEEGRFCLDNSVFLNSFLVVILDENDDRPGQLAPVVSCRFVSVQVASVASFAESKMQKGWDMLDLEQLILNRNIVEMEKQW